MEAFIVQYKWKIKQTFGIEREKQANFRFTDFDSVPLRQS